MSPEERVFDYRPAWDDRNRAYPVAPLLGSTSRAGRTYKYWWQGQVLDQGREGACVGFGWTAELMASPDRVKFEDPTGFSQNVYRMAQRIDEWPGEDYEGTSVLAGAKITQQFGFIKQYRWAFTIEEIIRAVVEVGPVVIGIPWYESMYETRPSGLVESLTGSDTVVGGHCLTLTGYSPKRRFYKEGIRQTFDVIRWRNSWGKSYGKNGSGYIRVEDLERLFRVYGEACVPLDRYAPSYKVLT